MPTTEKPGLTRDAIKYLAIFTMLLNHIANVLLPENTILWEVFIDIGYSGKYWWILVILQPSPCVISLWKVSIIPIPEENMAKDF